MNMPKSKCVVENATLTYQLRNANFIAISMIIFDRVCILSKRILFYFLNKILE